MLSYHNDPAIKAKYVARFAAHRAADEVIQGTGFENGRGCFVGCTLDKYDHERFPVELGWPEWLARLADRIFEGLPKEEAPEFGTLLLDAVPVGIDLELVRHLLAIRRMDRLIALQTEALGKHVEIDSVIQQVIASMQAVRACHEAEAAGNSCDFSAARSAAESAAWSAESARSAAWSAESAAESARSARSAARSAAESAWSARSAAWSAAWSAWSAESAAESAWSAAWSAWSAESAAESARSARSAARSAAESAWSARSAAFQQERDDLLNILRNMGETKNG